MTATVTLADIRSARSLEDVELAEHVEPDGFR